MATRLGRRTARWLVFLALAVFAPGPKRARAESQGPVVLTWTAPAGCPREDEVLAEALRLLAGPPIGPERRVEAVARVTRVESGRWRVALSMASAAAHGVRSLETDSCSTLAEATSLILAIMVDPDRAGAAASASDSPAPTSESPALPPSHASSLRPYGTGVRPRWGVGVSGLVDFGTLPAPAVGGAIGLAAIVRRFRADVSFGIFPARTYAVSSAADVRAEMSSWKAAGAFAYVIPIGSTELALGGGGEVTHLSAVETNANAPFSGVPGSATWLALRVGGGITVPIVAPFFLRLDGDAAVPLRRTTFVVDPLGTVYRPAAVGGRLGAGVEMQF
jgi:hypothetical protein